MDNHIMGTHHDPWYHKINPFHQMHDLKESMDDYKTLAKVMCITSLPIYMCYQYHIIFSDFDLFRHVDHDSTLMRLIVGIFMFDWINAILLGLAWSSSTTGSVKGVKKFSTFYFYFIVVVIGTGADELYAQYRHFREGATPEAQALCFVALVIMVIYVCFDIAHLVYFKFMYKSAVHRLVSSAKRKTRICIDRLLCRGTTTTENDGVNSKDYQKIPDQDNGGDDDDGW